MIPSILAKQIEKGLGDYIKTTFPMTNEPFKGSVERMLEAKNAVNHEPFIAVRLPFRVAEDSALPFEAIHSENKPYIHQSKAFARLNGGDGRSSLIATGTGSGKTECFLFPILEYCYKHRGEKGIKALLIYPMNALASDQEKRIAKLIYKSPELRGKVTAGLFVGGQEEKPSMMMTESNVITDHQTLLNNPPDILLTNYKMLDYLLVRPKDASLWEDNKPDTLKYIAVDELHTFDGAQGTDLACLLRRLKSRLYIQKGFLCCIGTSATMGSKDNASKILNYAEEVFGESFDKDAVITEDRLSPSEFFDESERLYGALPTSVQIDELKRLVDEGSESDYLAYDVKCWFPEFDGDVNGADGRLALSNYLMHHALLQDVVKVMNGNFFQTVQLVEPLKNVYPELTQVNDVEALLNSLFALVSHARIGTVEKLRPFLNVQVQLWMRELRRLVAQVSDKDVVYSIANDLNKKQARHYLPVVNCRDCGSTGWVSILNERNNATVGNLESFYNKYFKADEHVHMFFPGTKIQGATQMQEACICPECLQVVFNGNVAQCEKCGNKTIKVNIPLKPTATGKERKMYACPFCGSRRGLSLMGLRSATEISASLSQLFASKFNDDKKTLAFSDSVQDASHRAGFFNARTWNFGLRTAIQHYVQDGGAGQNFADFQQDFIKYWHEKMTDEDFVSYFIPPNMTWMRAYEEMLEKRKLADSVEAKDLISQIEKRLRYEILLEFGIKSNIGRTLEKSGCAIATFDVDELDKVVDVVYERIVNEQGLGVNDKQVVFQIVVTLLDTMRANGAINDEALYGFVNAATEYLLTNEKYPWMPGKSGNLNVPHIPVKVLNRSPKSSYFDFFSDSKYTKYIVDCNEDLFRNPDSAKQVVDIIVEELLKADFIKTMGSPDDYIAYGLNKSKLFISDSVSLARCGSCNMQLPIAADVAAKYDGALCRHNFCNGHYAIDAASLNYYGSLYSRGDLARVNAAEHTGLLQRDDREQLEKDFKRKKDERKIWDPNLLSCTPTLEMGIDIGDLSTVVLCSMPPAQAQYVQRTGRAGRTDGNALTLSVASAKPHDLYFYADPMDMIQGSVAPPKVFLKASAVLSRQFLAFCMDSWIRKGIQEDAIPRNVGMVLSKFDKRDLALFPFNFLAYVKSSLNTQLKSFKAMFTGELDDVTVQELETYAKGNSESESPMHLKILEAFESQKKQKKSLQANSDNLKKQIKELESKPKDSSYDEQIRELKAERGALLDVLRELGRKDIFNFFSDEGLLPNYAFPEAGIYLKAILSRKIQKAKTEETDGNQRRYEKRVYEYNRPAASAISEFAPLNSFYAGGRKLTIDQIDLSTTKSAKWRLCPNCTHAQLESDVKDVAACPNCGSSGWADKNQVRSMLKVQLVYSNSDYTKSLVGDESEDRSNVFYCKQLLVDVDEDHDIHSAYQMDNDDFPFGYEFVKKATLREINFGECDTFGEKLSVSGNEDVRKGFRVCKCCGKIQPDKGSAQHSYSCKYKKAAIPAGESAYEDCLFLYRQFDTEILRLLIPATTTEPTQTRTESFMAAFMLGMKEYFGNVDHLRATISDVPVENAEYRKQYLVIYDSVPGGTGYLKQLMHDEQALNTIFEKSLKVLENCTCKEDPQRDGCYHCLYAYRQSSKIGNLSRNTAIRLLKSILSGKDNVKKIDKLKNVSVNSLFDSELEQMFIETFSLMGNDKRQVEITDDMINGKKGYVLKIKTADSEAVWTIEPQVDLDDLDGVLVKCRPDFVLTPLRQGNHKKVAVFTDGFQFHKDIVASDTLKREAVRRSGKYRVWSLSYKDVLLEQQKLGNYVSPSLIANNMPSGAKMYKPTVNNSNAGVISPDESTPFELLMRYLEMPNAEGVFSVHARAYSLSLLDATKMKNAAAFEKWNGTVKDIDDQTHFVDEDFAFGSTLYGEWIPNDHFVNIKMFAGVSMETMKADKNAPIAVACVLDDGESAQMLDCYESDWNELWHFHNVMQFAEKFIAVSSKGLELKEYLNMPSPVANNPVVECAKESSAWDETLEALFDDTAKAFAEKAKELGIPVPDEIGYDLPDEMDGVLATVELLWNEKKVCFLTEEQMIDKDKLVASGWTIVTIDTLESVFGGNN